MVYPSLLEPTVIITGNRQVGSQLTLTGAESGGSGYFSFAWAGLPIGCTSFNVSILFCTPTLAGSYNVTLTVHDFLGATMTSAPLTILVNGTSPPPPPPGHKSNQTTTPVSPIMVFISSPYGIIVLVAGIVLVVIFTLLVFRNKRQKERLSGSPQQSTPPSPKKDTSAHR